MPPPHPSAPRPPADDLPDLALVARAADGDQQSYAELMRRHTPRMLALATRLLGDPVAAEDDVQEACLTAWRHLPDFRGEAAFGTWLYRIVTNRCLNTLRARRAELPLEATGEPASPDPAASPERAAESRASARDLRAALATLTPEQRACWVLRELHGLSYDEIAEVTGTGEPAVRGRIFRARRQLTEVMAPWR
ncbi:RNA polymerase sigma factor [Kitasatospora cineracea]|uniref:RNA polymerase sigma-70 factor (ECF subfamily) n=1 Tax=Kitasatospora cineracea TaxID=88074 RepID=A0A3N4RUU3_9ACTN|nr:sigma-70 family RNA polymerase sigma factor [Kitasatospora cineracea]ROR46958.1 RNA polymerase sigma-70 factor (ECF subfamily) [Kitasatospora cineracea]RPE37123.1 RNA polymerase sigma-70 factor (ECF subfamily) [Kitasatospora cineracea]